MHVKGKEKRTTKASVCNDCLSFFSLTKDQDAIIYDFPTYHTDQNAQSQPTPLPTLPSLGVDYITRRLRRILTLTSILPKSLQTTTARFSACQRLTAAVAWEAYPFTPSNCDWFLIKLSL